MVVLVWGVELGSRWVCDPELDALMGVSCSLLVAVLVRCTVLRLSSVLTSVMLVLGQSYSFLLVLPWPLWPWVCFLFFSV